MQFPEKYFYTIGDVSKMTGVKPHILRYWESCIKLLRPARRYSGHRKYTQREIDLINRIRYLVLERRFTLPGARREILRQLNVKSKLGGGLPSQPSLNSAMSVLKEIKNDVEDCLKILQLDSEENLIGPR
ncbi:MAG: MerR family transcriptional regulator [Elusimicrobia bacterium]|nr:MerR family transcriptional regulator [Candidatus Obscuribacterium magneticum]